MDIIDYDDGSRQITHPSGAVSQETAEQRDAFRAMLLRQRDDAQAMLDAFDAERPESERQA